MCMLFKHLNIYGISSKSVLQLRYQGAKKTNATDIRDFNKINGITIKFSNQWHTF